MFKCFSNSFISLFNCKVYTLSLSILILFLVIIYHVVSYRFNAFIKEYDDKLEDIVNITELTIASADQIIYDVAYSLALKFNKKNATEALTSFKIGRAHV